MICIHSGFENGILLLGQKALQKLNTFKSPSWMSSKICNTQTCMWLHPPFFSMQMLHFGQSCKKYDNENKNIVIPLCEQRCNWQFHYHRRTLSATCRITTLTRSSGFLQIQDCSNLMKDCTFWLCHSQWAHGKSSHIWSKIWQFSFDSGALYI